MRGITTAETWPTSIGKSAIAIILLATVYCHCRRFAWESFQDVDRKGGEADVLPQSETLHVGGAETVRGFQERSLGPMIFYEGERQELGGSHSNYYKLELRQKVYSESTALSAFIDTGMFFCTAGS